MSLVKAIAALPYVLAALALAMIYNALIENPAVRREARAGYVQEATIAALSATVLELRRQKEASDKALGEFQAAAEEAERVSTAAAAAFEKKVADYEAERRSEGRACTLSSRDLDELRRSGGAGAGR